MTKSSETPPTPDWYASHGVDYQAMDPFKRLMQVAAVTTVPQLKQRGGRELEWSRGESAHVVEIIPGTVIASTIEGLGTKNIVADAMYELTKDPLWYGKVAQDTVAMIVNDLISIGVLPSVVNMLIDTGSSDWFRDEERAAAFARGWAQACMQAGATWGGGESATLVDIVQSERSSFAGSTWGLGKTEQLIHPGLIEDKDLIILLESSGIHANGLTAARNLAKRLPDGYQTLVPNDGRCYGEALLDPTRLYVDIISECLTLSSIPSRMKCLHYAVPITGHGFRKLMRATESFVYTIDTLPPVPPVLAFIKEQEGMSDKDAYGNLNMGAGYALFVPQRYADEVLKAAEKFGHKAHVAGHIKKNAKRKVVLTPLGITYDGSALAVR